MSKPGVRVIEYQLSRPKESDKNAIVGYMISQAHNMEEAKQIAKICPILASA